MHVASLSPLSVGGLYWYAPEPCYTVVLKATFSLEQDGPIGLNLQQQAVQDERAGLFPHELRYGSDFAPRKVGVDVAMVGHARARESSQTIPFAFEIGELRRDLVATSAQPTRRIPLWSRHVRLDPDDPRSAVQLAPRPTATRAWNGSLVASSYDFGAFNVAGPEHRLDELPVDGVLRLEGLCAGSPVRQVRIGDTQPYVFYCRDCNDRSEADLLFPACDTLWIDTDRERLVVVWRCEARPEAAHANPFLAVVLGTRRVPPKWSDVVRQLPQARWHVATQGPDFVRWPESDDARPTPRTSYPGTPYPHASPSPPPSLATESPSPTPPAPRPAPRPRKMRYTEPLLPIHEDPPPSGPRSSREGAPGTDPVPTAPYDPPPSSRGD